MIKIASAAIDVLRYPDNVRLRHGMYLISPDHCIFEIVDNSTDEFVAGRCSTISVTVENNVVIVEDDGGGIPITPSKDPEYKDLSQAEVAYTVLHAGGKFGSKDGYQTNTGGMNGVGASCVNAVSESMILTIWHDGVEYEIDFSKGHTLKHLFKTGNKIKGKHGTKAKFILDKEIWKDEWFDFTHVGNRFKQLAYLNPGLTVKYAVNSHTVDNKEVVIDETFNFPDGLNGYINEVTGNKKQLFAPICFSDEYKYKTEARKTEIVNGKLKTDTDSSSEEERTISVDIAMVYTNGTSSNIKSFVNNVATEYGGDHETGFKQGLLKIIKKYAADSKNKIADNIESEDTREGLISLISVKLKDPVFEGQGKGKIKMSVVRTAVKQVFEKFFSDYLDENRAVANEILGKIETAIKVREAVRKAKETARGIKNIAHSSMPEGLSDCTSRNTDENEIFFVEGDSAGGSARQGRDRRIQAILPVFGKILNMEKSDIDSAISAAKLQDIFKVIGGGVGDNFDIDKVRYGKIILMSDAD